MVQKKNLRQDVPFFGVRIMLQDIDRRLTAVSSITLATIGE